MPEALDWKQKYRDAVLEIEGEEKRSRLVEQALRRLIGRLCAAGMGVDPKLDDELIALAAANRRNAEASELEKLASSLTSAVVAVDAVSPVPTVTMKALAVKRWDSTCDATGQLVQRLKSAALDGGGGDRMLSDLTKIEQDGELAAILKRIGDLLDVHIESTSTERRQSALVLQSVTKRLEEMVGFLAEAGAADRSRSADSAALNDTVLLQVQELSHEAKSATDLVALQAQVNSRLQSVTKQVLDFRSRESARLQEYSGRAQRMRQRIADLEREAQELNSKLDHEKHDARLDTLTHLANRRSFDERMALELQSRPLDAPPIALLLCDLDNFKSINDSYGHRAGDRVLQAVANAFATLVRPNDFVARVGGEEFVVLMPGVGLDEALRAANALRQGVESLRFHFRGTPVRMTVSCGLTEMSGHDTAASAFDRADAALYRAKNGGKNLCVTS